MKIPFNRKRGVENTSKAAGLLGESLNWSTSPGAYERHLQRRYHNPYFPECRREVSSVDLDVAKDRDAEDTRHVVERFEAFKNIRDVLPDLVPSARVKELRQEMDELACDAMAIGGEAIAIADAARKLRDCLVEILREALKSNPEDSAALERAAQFSKDVVQPVQECQFWAQALRKDSPIDGSELIAALITESPATIMDAVQRCPTNTTKLSKGALALLLKTKDEGYVDQHFDEKIAIFAHTAESSDE